MSAINDGGPAFPSGKSEMPGYENSLPFYEGMTLRDWFAGQALAGLIAASGDDQGAVDYRSNIVAESAYEAADAMLAARKGGTHE